MAVAQEAVLMLTGLSRALTASPGVLGQDTEPQIAPDAFECVCVCVRVNGWAQEYRGAPLIGSTASLLMSRLAPRMEASLISVWMCVRMG